MTVSTDPTSGPLGAGVVDRGGAAAGAADVPEPAGAPPRPAVDPRERDEAGRVARGYRRAVLTGDAVAAVACTALVVALWFGPGTRSGYALTPLAAPLLWVALVAAQRTYERRFTGSGTEEYRRVIDAGLLGFAIVAVASYAADADVSRAIVLGAVPLTVLCSLVLRRVLRARLAAGYAAGRGLRRLLIVGRADAAHGLIDRLGRQPGLGLRAVGVCLPTAEQPAVAVHDVPVIGDTERVLEAIAATQPHVVAVASHPELAGQSLRRLSWALEEHGIELLVVPGIVEVAGPRLSIRPIAELPLLHLERPATSGGRLLGKAVADRLLAAGMLLVLAPLLLGVAVAVRLGSTGPALFRQTRVGVDGREFTMLKFRSMVLDAEALLPDLAGRDEGNGMLFKMRADPRVTRVGAVLRRTSLDELPQLVNVLRGEMSLVGPRPPLPAEVAAYTDDAARRLRVRPGVTGLWQVSGRSDLSWEESLRLDLRYVDNWSPVLDLVILWRTLRAVARGSGAY